jgi:hypothetical protein
VFEKIMKSGPTGQGVEQLYGGDVIVSSEVSTTDSTQEIGEYTHTYTGEILDIGVLTLSVWVGYQKETQGPYTLEVIDSGSYYTNYNPIVTVNGTDVDPVAPGPYEAIIATYWELGLGFD